MEYLGIQEAADRLGVTRQTVWRMIKSKRLPVKTVGGRHVMSVEIINRLRDYRAMMKKQRIFQFERKGGEE